MPLSGSHRTTAYLILSLLVYSNCIPCYNRYQKDICFAALPSFLFLSRYLPHISSLSYHMYRDKCEPAPFFPFFDFFTSPYFSFQSCTYENGETLRSNTEMQNRIRDTQKSDRRTNRQLHLSMITYIYTCVWIDSQTNTKITDIDRTDCQTRRQSNEHTPTFIISFPLSSTDALSFLIAMVKSKAVTGRKKKDSSSVVSSSSSYSMGGRGKEQ